MNILEVSIDEIIMIAMVVMIVLFIIIGVVRANAIRKKNGNNKPSTNRIKEILDEIEKDTNDPIEKSKRLNDIRKNLIEDPSKVVTPKYSKKKEKITREHECEFDEYRISKLNRTCPSCHSTLNGEYDECPICGGRLDNVCPVCGLINHPTAILCQECHSKLKKKKQKYNDKKITHGKGDDDWMEF